jgi:hypothetical protein
LSGYLLIRLAHFATLAVLCALAVTDGMFFLAGLLGIGAVFTGGQLLDRKGTKRSELRRWRANQGGGFVCSEGAVMPRVSLPLHSSTQISRGNLRGRSPPGWALDMHHIRAPE